METHPAKGDVDRNLPHSRPHRPIPDYLQPFIVDQDPSRYTAIDHAVWRFVLLQLHDRLERTAHPSYASGLARSAISPERIPSIAEIDRGLRSIGWGAVGVDGFIPPRAFQAFQALGVLPIAAEIRTPEHLPYTPAPDIIHEAAGHAPILIDPEYAAYVRAVGEVGARAFASPADARIDRAVRVLSDLKEHPTDAADLRAAELELERAVAQLGPPSEAARVARLYWWTAEYGLVGTPQDYRLYGAGLLSSLGESHFCHRPEVRKLPLSPACTEVGYDITRPQPQLFVAHDFEHLHAVLAEVNQTLAHEVGGPLAVRAAIESGELCSVYLPGGAQVIGKLTVSDDTPVSGRTGPPPSSSLGVELLRFERGVALAQRGQLCGRHDHELIVLASKLADGSDPRRLLREGALRAGAALDLEYAGGLRVTGRVVDGPWALPEAALWLTELRVEGRGEPRSYPGLRPWLLADRVVTAGAGSVCPDVSPIESSAGEVPEARALRLTVPKCKPLSRPGQRLEQLYDEVHGSRGQGVRARAILAAVHAELAASYPHEWLLRWNVLDALLELGMGSDPLVLQIERRLRELEDYHGGEHPIALGLDYLLSGKRKGGKS